MKIRRLYVFSLGSAKANENKKVTRQSGQGIRDGGPKYAPNDGVFRNYVEW
jgi:hypothetical protein